MFDSIMQTQAEIEIVTYQAEQYKDCIDEALPLLSMHWEEIAHFKDIKLNPDFEQYATFDSLGMLRVYTARKNNILIGYAVYFVRSNPHYKHSLQAVQDILYIHPQHRGIGGRLILFADEALKEEGVEVVYQHIKAAHNVGRLLERLRYELVDLVYAKRLN